MTDLTVRLINDYLTEATYQASVAELRYRLVC